ncbi:MAG: hypothetical protein K2J54_02440 [Clostridia bacterium]|nr:hypothetical protein [Clostridia bacterium]
MIMKMHIQTATTAKNTAEIIIPVLDRERDFKLPVLCASLCATMLKINPISGLKNANTNPKIHTGE